MGPTMSPAKMTVAKVVTHRDFERELILAIEEFGLFEFVDVTQQANIVDVKKTREENSVAPALERLEKVVDSLGLDPTRRTGQVQVRDEKLNDSLAFVSEVIRAVEEEVLEIDSRTATARLELDKVLGTRDVALALEPLGIKPDYIGTTDYTFTTAGVIPSGQVSQLEWSLNEVTEGSIVFKSLRMKRGVHVVTVSVGVDRKEAVLRILSAMGFEAFSIPEGTQGTPEELVAMTERQIDELEKELGQLEKRKILIAYEWGPKVLAAFELMQVEQDRINIKRYMVFTERTIKAWGWIPFGKKEQFVEILERRVGAALEVTFQEPDFTEYESPTYLDNPGFMKPTQDVVEAFGTPSKHDLDPTKIMWLSFPIIFGIVFADVGQGFLIILIGLAAWYTKRKGQDWGAILGYIQSGAEGLIMMGIFAIVGGFLFGSFFGAETVIEPLWPIFAHRLENGEINPYRATHMLKLSIEIGAIQITLGILLDLYNRLKHRETRKSLIAFSYLWLYIGFVNLLFGVSYSSVNNWFAADGSVNLWIPIAGIGAGSGNNGVYPLLPISPLIFTIAVFLVPFIIMFLSSVIGGMDGFVHLLESGLGMISHTVSYARIFALNTVHIVLSGVFFTLIPPILEIPIPPLEVFGLEIVPEHVWHDDGHGVHQVEPYLPLLGAIIGTIIVGILEGLLAFMHTLRLHFVEWFSKFYHAGGTPFNPFYAEKKHYVPISEVPLQESYAVS